MQGSARISADDFREFLELVVAPGKRRRQARFANLTVLSGSLTMLVGLAGFGWALGLVVYHGALDELLRRPDLLVLAVIGVLLVPVAIMWLRGMGRLRGQIKVEIKDPLDETALRDGVNIGKMRFEFDDDGIRTSHDLVQESLSWDAFQGLEETEQNFFLMIDAGSAVIVPKEVFSGTRSLEAFKAFVRSRIGASG